ncbi:MAG: hypothetical protein IJ629_04155 [Clostridia bacterium]|nr:hypothetical protein [Clostridia bacterium]
MFYFLNSWTSLADDQIVSNVVNVERSIIGNILNVIRIAGSGIALIMLAWMSISYFSTDGKSMPFAMEKKADIKGRQLINFAIGVAVFIGASNIIYFVANFIEDIMKEVFS